MISLPPNVSSNLIFPYVYLENDQEFIVFYDYLDHSLSIINLSGREYLKKIALSKQGPDFVGSVGAMAVTCNQEIIIVDMSFITIMNFDGHVIQRLSINSHQNDLTGLDFDQFELKYNQYSGLQYDVENESLIMGITPLRRSNPQEYGKSTIAEVFLRERRIKPLPVFIPESFQSLQGDYGDLVVAGLLRRNDEYVYNFPLSSNIYTLRQGKTILYPLQSTFSDQLAPPIKDFSNGIDLARYTHKATAVNYFPLIFDRYNDLYYRIHKSSVRTLEEKPKYYLTVTDINFNKLEEVLFADGYYIFPIVSQEGLMFSAISKHDDKLELIRYRFL